MDYVFVNELSAASGSQFDSDEVFGSFTEMVRGLISMNGTLRIVSTEAVAEVRVLGSRFADWGALPGNKDAWLLTLGKLESPSRSWEIRESLCDPETELELNGAPFASGQAAFALGSALASFPTAPEWRVDVLPAEVCYLTEGGDLHSRAEDLANLSLPEHPEVHRSLLAAPSAPAASPHDAWARRKELYPHLHFLPRIEADIKGVRSEWARPLLHRLAELERSAASWDPSRSICPIWASDVTPDFAVRHHLMTFDDEGTDQVFDWHARISPGKGRLHFRIVDDPPQLRLAYVGPHL